MNRRFTETSNRAIMQWDKKRRENCDDAIYSTSECVNHGRTRGYRNLTYRTPTVSLSLYSTVPHPLQDNTQTVMGGKFRGTPRYAPLASHKLMVGYCSPLYHNPIFPSGPRPQG